MLDTLVPRVADEVTKRLTPVYASASNDVEVIQPPEVPLSTASDGSVEEMPIMENVSSLFNHSLTSVQSALSGEPNPVMHKALPDHLVSSTSLTIDSRVSDKLKSKIWNNEYFDFSALISNPVFENKYQLTINNSDKALVPSLCLEPVSKTKKYLSIELWLNCFHIFVGVYTRNMGMLCRTWRFGGIIESDMMKNFRFLRQSQPTAFPWSNIHWELWIRSQQTTVRKPQPQHPSISPGLETIVSRKVTVSNLARV